MMQFTEALSKVFDNCTRYYSGRPDGGQYVQYALILKSRVTETVRTFELLHKSKMLGGRTKWERVADVGSYRIHKKALTNLLESLRTDTFQWKGGRAQHKTMDQFETPWSDDTHAGYKR